MAPYATPSELASYMQQDLDASTATLVLTLASAEFSRIADTQFTSTAVTYTTTGTRATNVVLPYRPVIAVSAVRISTVVVTGYTLIRNKLYRAAGFGASCTVPPDLLEVDLTHGYTSVPDDVKGAVLETAAQAYIIPVAAMVSESIDDYAARYVASGGGMQLTPSARELAEGYRGVFVA